jgi:hypothetical protein
MLVISDKKKGTNFNTFRGNTVQKEPNHIIKAITLYQLSWFARFTTVQSVQALSPKVTVDLMVG